jgi:hypothetical protein
LGDSLSADAANPGRRNHRKLDALAFAGPGWQENAHLLFAPLEVIRLRTPRSARRWLEGVRAG